MDGCNGIVMNVQFMITYLHGEKRMFLLHFRLKPLADTLLAQNVSFSTACGRLDKNIDL